jgi:hypothetical protein
MARLNLNVSVDQALMLHGGLISDPFYNEGDDPAKDELLTLLESSIMAVKSDQLCIEGDTEDWSPPAKITHDRPGIRIINGVRMYSAAWLGDRPTAA